MKLICDYHLTNPDQEESMRCPDCNKNRRTILKQPK